jgi:uncharacterized protein YceK
MKTKILFLSLLLSGCSSTTKIPIEGSWFTSNGNKVKIETKDNKVYTIKVKEPIILSNLPDSIVVKKEVLPFGIWKVYTYPSDIK